MQSTILAPDDNWAEDTALLAPTDETDYYLTTVSETPVSPGDSVDILIGEDDLDDQFTGIVIGTAPVDEVAIP